MLAIWGGSLGAVYTAALTMLGRIFATEQLTGASSAQSLAFEIGAVSGPLLAGIGMRAWNPDGMLIVIGAAGIFLACYGLRTYFASHRLSA
jgi:predicted MFS family arabinose efflux permease